MSGRVFQRWVLLIGALLPLLFCRPGWSAEPTASEIQVAQRLFQRATADEELGRWEPALKTLREIEAIKVTAGVLFHIAVCEQNLGRYVEALNDLGRAEEVAQVNGDDSVLELVPDRRKEIEAMVAYLRVEIIGAEPGVEVRVDGQRISAAAVRVDIPLDPREHSIALLRPNKPTVTRTIVLKSGGRLTERFDLSAPAVTAEYASGQPHAFPESTQPNVIKNVVMYSAYGLALGAVGAGVYFVMDANDNAAEARAWRNEVAASVRALEAGGHAPFSETSECDEPVDISGDASQQQLEEDRRQACAGLRGSIDNRDRSETLAIWSFAIAGVGALGGTAVLLFWPDAEGRTALRVTPTLGGALISGRF